MGGVGPQKSKGAQNTNKQTKNNYKFDSLNLCKKSDMVVDACNPSSGRLEPTVFSMPGRFSATKFYTFLILFFFNCDTGSDKVPSTWLSASFSQVTGIQSCTSGPGSRVCMHR